MKRIIPLLFTLALICDVSTAQVEIDRRRPANPKGEVYVENTFGSVEIVGWDKREVAVSGKLAAGAEGLDLDGDKESVSIDVDVPEAWLYASDVDTEYRTTLLIHVPAGSSVQVETLNASVTVRGVEGSVEVQTVNGAISIEGNPRDVDLETMTGTINVSAAAAEMEVESISGAVTLRGARRAVEVTTVSGAIEVHGKDFESVELKSTAGDVRFAGSLRDGDGDLEIETFSGAIVLTLPKSVRAQFRLITFSGKIDSALGPKTSTAGRFNPYQKLRFSTGSEDFEVSVQSYEGNITLQLSDAAPSR